MCFPCIRRDCGSSLCMCECVGSYIHSCVCSNAAQPGSAPNLCSPVPEGSLLQWLQPEVPLQEQHRPLLSAHFCWVDTARGVRKSPPPPTHKGHSMLGERQKRGGLVVHDGLCEGVTVLNESRISWCNSWKVQYVRNGHLLNAIFHILVIIIKKIHPNILHPWVNHSFNSRG